MSAIYFGEVPAENTVLTTLAWFWLRGAASATDNPSRRDTQETRLGSSEPNLSSLEVSYSRCCLGQRTAITGSEVPRWPTAEGLHEGRESANPSNSPDNNGHGSRSRQNCALTSPSWKV